MSRHRSRIYRFLFFLGLCCLGGGAPGWADYHVIEVSDGGTIKGQALWKGAIPKVPPLRVFADLDACGTQVPSPVLQIDPATRQLPVLTYTTESEGQSLPGVDDVTPQRRSPGRASNRLDRH